MEKIGQNCTKMGEKSLMQVFAMKESVEVNEAINAKCTIQILPSMNSFKSLKFKCVSLNVKCLSNVSLKTIFSWLKSTKCAYLISYKKRLIVQKRFRKTGKKSF